MNTEEPPDYTTAIESIVKSGWSIPLWFVIVVTVSATIFCWWIYWSERGPAGRPMRYFLATIRIALIVTVLWMLAGWSWVRFKTQRPELACVIDVSASMATRDVAGQSTQPHSRLEEVKEILAAIGSSRIRSLDEDYQIGWFAAAESLEKIPAPFSRQNLDALEANGAASRLGECLIRLLERQSGRGTAAIVFLSDGINTAGKSLEDVAKLARSAAIPMYTVAVGRDYALPDVRLADPLLEKEVYFGDRVTAEVTVIASDIDSQPVTVTLSDAKSRRKFDETELTLTSDRNQQTARLSFVPDQPGEIELLLAVSAVANESELSNNSLTTTVNVQDKSIRILLVQGKPSYEFRFLKHFLERSTQTGDTARSSFEVQSVLQDSDPAYVAQDKSAIRLVPSSEQIISEFDVFVFGEFDPNLVSRKSQAAVYEAVTEAGAGCIFVYGAGSPAKELDGWPLGELLPVRDENNEVRPKQPTYARLPIQSANALFYWQLTPLGSNALPMQMAESPQPNERLWQKLPRFSSSCEIGTAKVGAQVLANAVSSDYEFPVLITQYAGAGRVAFQAMDETYRWTTFAGSDLYHQRYWGQTLRWLSRGKLVEKVQASKLVIEPQQAKFAQPIRFEATIGNEIQEADLPDLVEVAVEDSENRQRKILLSNSRRRSRLYQATATEFPPGNYRALLVQPVTESQPDAEFIITAPPGEQAILRANIDAMRALAERSRGRFYTGEEAARLFDELPPGTPTRLGTLPPNPLWNSPWVALWFVSLITLEWLLRRFARML